MQKNRDLELLQQMKPTQWCYVNWHEGGGGEVQRIHLLNINNRKK